ncbi:MAG: DJ-1/PfpI family protein [Erysipelotrichaceae bacterium]|nr:DJ-1/PfpI family protein [Erysipelotrichaceae bacterium]
MKTAVIFAPGFEEGEALTIVDILRRANIPCDIAGFMEETEGAHQIVVKSDIIVSEELNDYDMVILPGGYDGSAYMRDNALLQGILKTRNEAGKWIAAMCAAPIALETAGVLDHHKYTAYVGYDKKIKAGTYLEDKVVVDGNLVTSRGPATVYAFAYKLVDVLGGDSLTVKKRMVYFNAFDVKEDE